MPTKKQLLEILETAVLAPSVHNTQPWKLSIEDDSIILRLDSQHALTDGDPTGRQTVISMGIFTEAFILGAENTGFNVEVQFMGDYVEYKLKSGGKSDKRTVDLLQRRATDRSIYKLVDVPSALEKELKSCAEATTRVWLMKDKNHIDKSSELIGKGIGVALSSPSFRHELSRYLVTPFSRKNRGISTKSLYIPGLLTYIEPVLLRFGIGLKAEVSLEIKRWKSSSGIVFITSHGDMPKYWFAVGRTYLRASLLIEKYGLCQATSAAIVEASNFHDDVEEMLGTKDRIQTVIRIGSGAKKRHYSPRVNPEELIA